MVKVADSRIVMALTCAGTVILALAAQTTGTLLFAQFQIQVAQIDLSPPDAADNDVITFRLTGIWSTAVFRSRPWFRYHPAQFESTRRIQESCVPCLSRPGRLLEPSGSCRP